MILKLPDGYKGTKVKKGYFSQKKNREGGGLNGVERIWIFYGRNTLKIEIYRFINIVIIFKSMVVTTTLHFL